LTDLKIQAISTQFNFWELTVADPLKSPTLNFHNTLDRLLEYYNKKFELLNLDQQPLLARTIKIDEKFTKNRLIN
jgi:hypothetical protein